MVFLNFRVFRNAQSAALLLLRRPKYFLVSALCDFATVFLFGGLAPLRDAMVRQVYAVGTAVAGTGKIWEIGLIATLAGEGVRSQTLLVLTYFFGLLLANYLIYSVFQGVAWGVAFKTSGLLKNHDVFFFIKTFAKINLFGFSFYGIYQVLDLIISVRHTIMERVAQTTIPDVLGIILVAVAVLVGLIAVVSYVKMSVRTAFLAMRTRAFFSFAAVVFVSLFILDMVLRSLLSVNADLAIGVGLFVLPLATAWVRLLALLQFAEVS